MINNHHVAFSGYIGSGKTSLADMMVKHLGYTKVSFADVLKEEYSLIKGIPVEDLYTEGVKEKYRKGLQDLGSERRLEDKNYWVKALIKTIDSLDNVSIVVDDMRYSNELIFLARKNFILVRLNCPYVDSLKYILSKGKSLEDAERSLAHASEYELSNCDGFFDVVVDAPRSRDLDSIFSEILAETNIFCNFP